MSGKSSRDARIRDNTSYSNILWLATFAKLSMGKHYEKHLYFFSNSQKRPALQHDQNNDKCPDSSHSPLKRNCSTKWVDNYDVTTIILAKQMICFHS